MTLKDFFRKTPHCAIAFSGGVDSSYLLAQGSKYAKKLKAYYVKSAFQPQFELDDAVLLAKQHNCEMEIIELDVLSSKTITDNPQNRCYYCKKTIFGHIISRAQKDGFAVILDGTNASDDVQDRPGMQALTELGVQSPLREAGLTKQRIRELSKQEGLFTHDKPAYACLATRVPTGTQITKEILNKIEHSEDIIKSMGFTDFRLRYNENFAKLQVPQNQMHQVIDQSHAISQALSPYYKDVLLDLKSR